MPDLITLAVRLLRAIGGAIDVRRNEPDQHHTAAEYADALLFGRHDNDSNRYVFTPSPQNWISRNTPVLNA